MDTNKQSVVDKVETALFDVGQVSKILCCSTRTVYRLSDAGRMPRPMKLGSLVGWSRSAIESWIVDGCPSCRRKGCRKINLKKQASAKVVGQKQFYPDNTNSSIAIIPCGLDRLRSRLGHEIGHILLYLHNPHLRCCERSMAWRLLTASLRHYMALKEKE